jgi:hypothetical protein
VRWRRRQAATSDRIPGMYCRQQDGRPADPQGDEGRLCALRLRGIQLRLHRVERRAVVTIRAAERGDLATGTTAQ